VIGFIDHFTTLLASTSNYSVIATLHILQITTAHTQSLPACCVFTSRSLATASINEDSSSQPSSDHWTRCSKSCRLHLGTDRTENTVSTVAVQLLPFSCRLSRIRYPATGVVLAAVTQQRVYTLQYFTVNFDIRSSSI
jgi:hypothetical protein